jgi:tRNA nucleotidyltransferase (CCA-adding enzyme)
MVYAKAMDLPHHITAVLQRLTSGGFAAYAVGGALRDLLLKRTPKDWDVATSATPEQIQELFPKSFYANKFGTVTVQSEEGEVEVTTFRVDATYSDHRHPDSVTFSRRLLDDLSRRDFTINALALLPLELGEPSEPEVLKNSVVLGASRLIDPFGGLKDLDQRLIRAVGEPAARFTEDALRLLRAVRFAAELGFTLESATLQALKAQASLIGAVSPERLRDELIKIVQSHQPEFGLKLLEQTGLLALLLPELAAGVGIAQNKHHIYTVFEHNVKSLQYAARYNYSLPVRLAALLHDIGKPSTRRYDSKQQDYTFYGHDIVGARLAENILTRLRFPGELIKHVTHLVRHHMFYYDVGRLTEAGVRRLLRRVGPKNFADLIQVRIAERKGSGVPKAEPYRLRHLQFMVEKVAQQPLSTSELAIDGHTLMTKLNLKPGPQIGGLLNALLAEVIAEPTKNKAEYLLQRASELKDEDPETLKQRGLDAVEKQEKLREEGIRRKYHV